MLKRLLKNIKNSQEVLLVFGSSAVLTILYFLLLRHADKFPSGVPEIFTFVYGTFITINAHILFNLFSKNSGTYEERYVTESELVGDLWRYDLVLKEVQKEIGRLEEILPESKGRERESVAHQIDTFQKRMFLLQEQKYSEIEKMVRVADTKVGKK